MRTLALLLTAAALAWALMIVSTPRLLASGDGGEWSLVYLGSSQICHQRPERSFRSAGLQWPVCARCAGLYLSGALGMMLGWSGGAAGVRVRDRWLLVLAAVPTALTWTFEAAGIHPFSNVSRALAAVPLGIAAGWLFIRVLRYDSGLDARKNDSRRTPSLHG